MKKEYSAIKGRRHSKGKQNTCFQSKNTRRTLLGTAFLFMLLASACSTETYSDNSAFMADTTETQHEKYAQRSASIGDGIKNSYARLASERSDVCPKLIEQRLDSKVIERTAEVMTKSHCDYYLYPQEGQYIMVEVDDPKIEALLVVPAIHHFDNDGYEVKSYDKHVIRLAYDGVTHKPKNLNYDVAITISDSKYS